MSQALEDLITDASPFDHSYLNVQGYEIVDVSKSKAQSGKFKASAKFDFPTEHLVSAIEGKGKVFAYTKNRELKAIYIFRAEEDKYVCDECYLAPDIKDEPVTGLMECQVAFLMAERATYLKKKVIFLGRELPKLERIEGKFNWAMACCFAALYSVVFSQSFKNVSGIAVGIPLGFCMGLCFRSAKYRFEGANRITIRD